MTAVEHTARRFRVRAPHADDHHGYVVIEAGFEAAAIAYVEDRAFADAGEMTVMVHDLESGHEHCFRIDLASGTALPCQ